MSQPVIATNIKAVSINAQGILIIAFLAIVCYIIFAGGNNKNSKSSDPYTHHPPASDRSVGSEGTREPSSARSLGPGSVAPSSGNFASGIQAESSGRPAGPQNISDASTPAGQPPIVAPSAVRRFDIKPDSPPLLDDHGYPVPRPKPIKAPDRPPTPIIRTPNTVKPKRPIEWPDGKQEGPIKGGYVNPVRSEPKPPEKVSNHKVHVDLNEVTVVNMFKNVQLPSNIRARLQQIEISSNYDRRGRILGAIPYRDYMFQGTREEHPDREGWDEKGKFWRKEDWPERDAWDSTWGSLPELAMEACVLAAAWIRGEDVKTIGELMEAREGASKKDKERSWRDFAERTGLVGNDEFSPLRLTIGWFADTYRCVNHANRMAISNQFVNMREKLPLVVNTLQWLEGLGRRFLKQRLFSETGLELHGNVVRVACPAILLQSGQEDNPDAWQYDYVVYVFMWGGPVNVKEGFTEEKAMRVDWATRLYFGWKSSRALQTELNNILAHDYKIYTGSMEFCNRRRLVFRPGFTVSGINASMRAVPPKVDARLVHRNGTVERRADAIIFEPKDFGDIPRSSLDEILTFVSPDEVGIFDLRQYQWDTATLTVDNSRLNHIHLLTIITALGTAGDPMNGFHCRDTLSRLDFGRVLPLLHRDNPAATQSPIVFYPLHRLSRLRTIVIPYKPVSAGQYPTASLLLDPTFELFPCLTDRPIVGLLKTEKAELAQLVPGSLTVLVVCQNQALVKEFEGDIKSKMRQFKLTADHKALESILVVDGSPSELARMSGHLQGSRLRLP